MRRGPAILLSLVLVLAAWAVYSYLTAGFVHVLVSGTPGQGPWLERVRATVAGWGRLAPLVYMLAVVVEVIVAPIPGTLLYAPAGAIFGGFVGGSLSLAGNVIGAAIACVIGRMIGERVLAERADGIADRTVSDAPRTARPVDRHGAAAESADDVRSWCRTPPGSQA